MKEVSQTLKTWWEGLTEPQRIRIRLLVLAEMIEVEQEYAETIPPEGASLTLVPGGGW